MQVVLVMFRSGGDRRSFSVVRDITVIGRREDCDLRIPVGEVSRKHCRLIRDDNEVRLEDLGSSNGTFHNGVRVQGTTTLEPGDSIQVGPVVFVVQIDGVPADEELVPFTERAAHELEDLPAEEEAAYAAGGAAEGEEAYEENTEPLSMESDGAEGEEHLTDEPLTLGEEPAETTEDMTEPLGMHEEGGETAEHVEEASDYDAVGVDDMAPTGLGHQASEASHHHGLDHAGDGETDAFDLAPPDGNGASSHPGTLDHEPGHEHEQIPLELAGEDHHGHEGASEHA